MSQSSLVVIGCRRAKRKRKFGSACVLISLKVDLVSTGNFLNVNYSSLGKGRFNVNVRLVRPLVSCVWKGVPFTTACPYGYREVSGADWRHSRVSLRRWPRLQRRHGWRWRLSLFPLELQDGKISHRRKQEDRDPLQALPGRRVGVLDRVSRKELCHILRVAKFGRKVKLTYRLDVFLNETTAV